MVKRWAIFSEKMGISVERKSGFGQWGLRESSKLGSCFRANLLSLVDMESTKNSEDRN